MYVLKLITKKANQKKIDMWYNNLQGEKNINGTNKNNKS